MNKNCSRDTVNLLKLQRRNNIEDKKKLLWHIRKGHGDRSNMPMIVYKTSFVLIFFKRWNLDLQNRLFSFEITCFGAFYFLSCLVTRLKKGKHIKKRVKRFFQIVIDFGNRFLRRRTTIILNMLLANSDQVSRLLE